MDAGYDDDGLIPISGDEREARSVARLERRERRRQRLRQLAPEILPVLLIVSLLLGVAFLSWGASLAWRPAGWMTAGGLLILIPVTWARGASSSR